MQNAELTLVLAVIAGNMMVVLLAMGGYGAGYLGWAIRQSDDEVRGQAALGYIIA